MFEDLAYYPVETINEIIVLSDYISKLDRIYLPILK